MSPYIYKWIDALIFYGHKFKPECSVDGVLSQIPTFIANVANSMTEGQSLSNTLNMRGGHVASLVKFHSVV